MGEIKYTLLTEGTSDKALIPILNWLLKIYFPSYAIQSEWADLGRLPKPPKSLPDRIKFSLQLYPCDVLFVHRDADNQGRLQRVSEIESAFEASSYLSEKDSLVCVVPVRMTEAWLLSDERAIRLAADNPNGKNPLTLPQIGSIEQCADPKTLLHNNLEQASGVAGRRLKKFKTRMGSRVQRISELTQDFSPLRRLEAFRILETEVKAFSGQHSSRKA